MINVNKKILQQMTTRLQGIMRIQDWDILIDVMTAKEIKEEGLHDPDTCGYIDMISLERTAMITINSDNELDWYYTLVHELYHIVTNELAEYSELLGTLSTHQSLTDAILTLHTENLVNHLTKIFIQVYPETMFDDILIPFCAGSVEFV